jgi:hypothetical protein
MEFDHKGFSWFSLGKSQSLGLVGWRCSLQVLRSSDTLLGKAMMRMQLLVFGVSIVTRRVNPWALRLNNPGYLQMQSV